MNEILKLLLSLILQCVMDQKKFVLQNKNTVYLCKPELYIFRSLQLSLHAVYQPIPIMSTELRRNTLANIILSRLLGIKGRDGFSDQS